MSSALLTETVESARTLRADLDSYMTNMIAGRVERDDDYERDLRSRLDMAERSLGLAATTDVPEPAVVVAEPEAELLTLF